MCERESTCEREGECVWERACVRGRVSVCVRERERASVCVCERDSVRLLRNSRRGSCARVVEGTRNPSS